MINNLIIGCLFLLCSISGHANEIDFPLETAPKRVNELAALQNGAKLFVNYCLNCHSANSFRYSKLRDIGLTDQQIRDNLLFTGEKTGDPMNTAMSSEDSKKWFGTTPPDLSVIARAKSSNRGSGTDYIYTYMRSFYRDISKPTGWDNIIFPGVAMPHPLWNHQGSQELVISQTHKLNSGIWERITTTFDQHGFSSTQKETIHNSSGKDSIHAKFIPVDKLKSISYDNDIADLAAFMSWMAEPEQLFRKRLGVLVLFFLGFFFLVAWRLNNSYWKYIK